jgi:hypothetical protein
MNSNHLLYKKEYHFYLTAYCTRLILLGGKPHGKMAYQTNHYYSEAEKLISDLYATQSTKWAH